ncbi:MAG: hypothetical protein ABSD67_01285 [Terracidiphilus sp.]|jgi:hypothetical protein
MSLMRRPVLQLNASYEALRIIPAMRALKLVTKGKATVELATNMLIYPGIYLPSVIRLPVYKHVPVGLQLTAEATKLSARSLAWLEALALGASSQELKSLRADHTFRLLPKEVAASPVVVPALPSLQSSQDWNVVQCGDHLTTGLVVNSIVVTSDLRSVIA